MNSEKNIIAVRFRSDFAEMLEIRAWYEGSRLGTLTNRLIRNELQKVSRVGERYIISKGSAEYDELVATEGLDESYYLLPEIDEIISFMPTNEGRRGTKLMKNKQVSLYLAEDEVNQLNKVVYAQDVFGTYNSEKILSYRYAIHGLLLNTELVKNRFTKISNTYSGYAAKKVLGMYIRCLHFARNEFIPTDTRVLCDLGVKTSCRTECRYGLQN